MVDEAAPSSDDRSVTYTPSAAAMAAFETSAGHDFVSRCLRALFYNTLYVIAAWIVANAASVAFDLDGVQRDALGSVLIIAAMTSGYGVEVRRWARAQADAFQARYREIGDLTVTLEPDALSVSSRRFQLRIVWASVQTIEMRQGFILIAYLGMGRGVAIPVRMFADEAAARGFAEAARRLKDGAERAAGEGPSDPPGAE